MTLTRTQGRQFHKSKILEETVVVIKILDTFEEEQSKLYST